MSLAVLILSSDGGRKSATLIGSTKEDALAAWDAVYMPARYGYLDADSAAAFRYISRAWEVMGHGA